MAAKAKQVSKTATKTANSTKKVAVKKSIPAKKTVATKKVVAKNPTPASKATPKKVVAIKKTATKKAVAKKLAPIKKTAVKKAVVKKVAVKKVVAAKKTAKPIAKTAEPLIKNHNNKATVATKKDIKTKDKNTQKTATTAVNEKATKVVVKEKLEKQKSVQNIAAKGQQPAEKPKRRKKDDFVPTVALSAREEIVDAIREKPKKTLGKPGVVIAQRSFKKEIDKSEIKMSEFNPNKRSLLDEPVTSTGVRKRYSDEDLNEFKELILGRLENARKELVYLQGLITRKDEAGTEDTDNRFNHMEDGSGAMEREQLSQLAGRQIQFINHLEKAIVRIENKTYGVCRVTGELIDKARLRAVPHATLSIEAKNMQNK